MPAANHLPPRLALLACACALSCGPGGSSITGTLLDKASKRPLADVRFDLAKYTKSAEADEGEWTRAGSGASAVTDAEGRFTFARVTSGRYALAANPNEGEWREPPSIGIEIPAPGHALFIDVADGAERVDIGTLFGKTFQHLIDTYGPACTALENEQPMTTPLEFDLVVLTGSGNRWGYDSIIERELLQTWRPASPTLICLKQGGFVSGVYQTPSSLSPGMRDVTEARTLTWGVWVFDAKGVDFVRMWEDPPAITTAPFETRLGQEEGIRRQLRRYLARR